MKQLRAQDLMTSPVVAVREGTFFEEAAELLAERGISGFPVVNADEQLVGVVSERDLAHALGGPLIRLVVRRPHHPHLSVETVNDMPRDDRRVGRIMTSPAISVHPDTPLHTLAEIMVKEEVNRLPVVREQEVVGIVTRGDLLTHLGGIEHRLDRSIHAPVVVGSAASSSA